MHPSMFLSASDRLRRSKSSRSIRRSHQSSGSGEPFDPDIARQHATVAASLAMRRSTERSSTDSHRSYDRLGGPGSMAVPQRRHRPGSDTDASDTASTVTMQRPQVSIASDVENSKDDHFSLAALPPINEFGGLDGRNSSQPSSYRRLRKSRSMFAAGQRFSRAPYGASSRGYGYSTTDKAQGLESRARSFSSSIKRGIKRALGLSKPVAEHSEAQRSPLSEKASQILPISRKDGAYSIEHGRDAVCPDRLATFNAPSTVRSIRSSESLASSCSRVTSWADSTVANTIVTRKAGEQTHLSIIDERGDSKQNLSLLTPGNSPRQECPSTSGSVIPERSIDSKRLTQDTEEEIVLGQVREHRAVPTRASSLYPHSSRQTIRRVPTPGGTTTPQKCPAMVDIRSAPEDNIRSIIAAGPQGSVTPDSPSVYSRTTSVESPTAASHEPGVATIYESQRHSSSEQWMQSQMARIENLTPTREHYREDAQLYDEPANLPRRALCRDLQEDDGILASQPEGSDHGGRSAKREPTTTYKIRAGSNFSRPFSRSPSVRTMVTVSKEYAFGAAASSSTPIPVSPTITRSSGEQSFSVGRIRGRVDQSTTSPMQSRPINRLWMPESPTPKREAREISQGLTLSGKRGRYSAKWSPGQDTRGLPFRSSRYRDSVRFTNENLRADDGYSGRKEPYMLSQDTYSPMSSKRMVELFLNSRRQQLGTEMSDDSAPDGAFL
ncbi:hypothetical protein BDV29DRAFT_192599 [Aspergillus leporis]|uniref:Uncharacterized protein n=1 Tax=Aspergillus leporis TaxID=41062 RepID=A0A5N5WVK4_9EURO|nr:hypothetical protein BDV29DRAFT_192599 [Aspergillus leporis]